MKLLASEHFRKKLEKRKIISTVLFFEKTRNPVKYEMMKNEKQFLKTQIEILQKMLLKTTRQLHKKRVKEIHLLKCNMKTLSNLLKMKRKKKPNLKKKLQLFYLYRYLMFLQKVTEQLEEKTETFGFLNNLHY